MIAREFLEVLGEKNEYINLKLDKLAELKSRYGVSGGLNTDDRVQTSLKADKMTDLVSKVIELEQEIDRLVDEYYDYKKLAIKEIYKIKKPVLRLVLHQRYILMNTINQTAIILDKKKQTIKNYTDLALKELQIILDIDEIC